MSIRFNARNEIARINNSFSVGRLSAVDRRAFLSRPFEQQAALIGEHAKLQLAKVDQIISRTFTTAVPKNVQNAVGLWEGMIASKIQDSEAMRIAAVCSGLRAESENIAGLFGGCYRFWVDNFYSCDVNGVEDVGSAQSSQALSFTRIQMKTIDELSGMDSLGLNIRGYARGYAEFLSRLKEGDS